MLRGLFGSGPRARVFLRPGVTLPKEVLRAHRLRHAPALRERRAGQTTNFIVFSDGTSNGDAAAQAMLASAEGDFQATQQWFGGLTPPNLPFYVYVDPNAGGAYHLTCAGTDVHVLSDPGLAPGFLTAEIVEVFEAARNNGWDCGFTNGESLSRVLAFDRHPEMVADLVPHRFLHLALQLALIRGDVLVVALVEHDPLGEPVLEHGRALVKPEQVGVFTLADRVEIGQVVDHDHRVGHLRLEFVRHPGQGRLGEPSEPVARDPMGDDEAIAIEGGRPSKRGHRIVTFEPDPEPPQQVPRLRILVAVERTLGIIRCSEHVTGPVCQAGGEPEPSAVLRWRLGLQFAQRVLKPFRDRFDRAIHVTVAGLF